MGWLSFGLTEKRNSSIARIRDFYHRKCRIKSQTWGSLGFTPSPRNSWLTWSRFQPFWCFSTFRIPWLITGCLAWPFGLWLTCSSLTFCHSLSFEMGYEKSLKCSMDFWTPLLEWKNNDQFWEMCLNHRDFLWKEIQTHEEKNKLLFPLCGGPNYSEHQNYDSGFTIKGEIRFENVDARYKQNQSNILKGVNVAFEAGKTAKIQGEKVS